MDTSPDLSASNNENNSLIVSGFVVNLKCSKVSEKGYYVEQQIIRLTSSVESLPSLFLSIALNKCVSSSALCLANWVNCWKMGKSETTIANLQIEGLFASSYSATPSNCFFPTPFIEDDVELLQASDNLCSIDLSVLTLSAKVKNDLEPNPKLQRPHNKLETNQYKTTFTHKSSISRPKQKTNWFQHNPKGPQTQRQRRTLLVSNEWNNDWISSSLRWIRPLLLAIC